MVRGWFVSLLSFSLLIALSGCSGGGTDGTAPLGARSVDVTATLLDSSGSALADADVLFQGDTGGEASATTNAAGLAQVSLLEAATYTISVNLGGQPITSNSFAVKAGLGAVTLSVVVDVVKGTALASITSETPRQAAISQVDPVVGDQGANPGSHSHHSKKPSLSAQNAAVAGVTADSPPPTPQVNGSTDSDKFAPPKPNALSPDVGADSTPAGAGIPSDGSEDLGQSNAALQGGDSTGSGVTVQSGVSVGSGAGTTAASSSGQNGSSHR